MTIISSNKLHKRDFNVDRMEEIKEVRPEINFTTCEAAKHHFECFILKVHFVEGFLFEKTKKHEGHLERTTSRGFNCTIYTSSVFPLSASLQVTLLQNHHQQQQHLDHSHHAQHPHDADDPQEIGWSNACVASIICLHQQKDIKDHFNEGGAHDREVQIVPK